MAYSGKTNWTFGDTVTETDLNRIEQGIKTLDLEKAGYTDVNALQNQVAVDGNVRVATTVDISLSGTQTIDGVALTAGDRVLVKSQTDGKQNGVYVVGSGGWMRAADADSTAKITAGIQVYVREGTVNGGKSFAMNNTGTVAINTTPLTFVQISGPGADTTKANLESPTFTGTVGAPRISATNNSGRQINAYQWADLSSNAGGQALFANNAYTDGSSNWRYSNTHPSLGARGIRLSEGGGLQMFDTGTVATTANATFTPAWVKIAPLDSPGFTGTPTAPSFASTAATGVAPLTVASTTKVANLNADMVDGYHLDQDVRSTASPSFIQLTSNKQKIGKYFQSFLGEVTSAASTPNQKVDVYFTQFYMGYFDVVISGVWNQFNAAGQVRKRFSLITSSGGAINAQDTDYIEAVGNIANGVALSNVTYDSTNSRWRVQIALPNALNSYSVYVEGLMAPTVQESFGIGSIYTTDSTVLPMAYRSFTRKSVFKDQIESTVTTGTAPLVVNSTTKVQSLNADLVDGYEADQNVIANTVAVRLSNGDLNARVFGSTAATGTPPLVVNSTTVVTNLNADMVDGYHATTAAETNKIAVRDENGDITARRFSSVVANGSGIAPFDVLSTKVVTNLNADMVDGWHIGNSANQVPVSNGVLSTNLNADLLDGQHGSYFAPLASPALTGTPTVPTATVGTNTTQAASTAFVQSSTAAKPGTGTASSVEGIGTSASGYASHAEGNNTTAAGVNSHAEGYYTLAATSAAHGPIAAFDAGGKTVTLESQNGSLSVGDAIIIFRDPPNGPVYDTVSSVSSLVIGLTTATPSSTWKYLIKVGNFTGSSAYAEGSGTLSLGWASHAEGSGTIASAQYSHSEGYLTKSSGSQAHAEGNNTTASGTSSHAEGNNTTASGNYAHAEGDGGVASGQASHVEGLNTKALSYFTHAEGRLSAVLSECGHAEGYGSKVNVTSGSSITPVLNTDLLGASAVTTYAGHAEGFDTLATGAASHAEGASTLASGHQSHTEGNLTVASGAASHAEGGGSFSGYGLKVTAVAGNTLTVGAGHSFAIGQLVGVITITYNGSVYSPVLTTTTVTSANIGTGTVGVGSAANISVGTVLLLFDKLGNGVGGRYAHSEGLATFATGSYSHTEGYNTFSGGSAAHAEGTYSIASADSAHAEGLSTTAAGPASHAQGSISRALTAVSHAEGYGSKVNVTTGQAGIAINNTDLLGTSSVTIYAGHAEGFDTLVTGAASHAEGMSTVASGLAAHAEGYNTRASATYSHAEGSFSAALSVSGHAEGLGSKVLVSTPLMFTPVNNTDLLGTSTISSFAGHAEGTDTLVTGAVGHAEGVSTVSSGTASHAEGQLTTSSGQASHAEGISTSASGIGSHAEGRYTQATQEGSHAEGSSTTASGPHTHAEGLNTVASGYVSHAQGDNTVSNAWASHAEGIGTNTAGFAAAHIMGNYGDANAAGAWFLANGTSSSAKGLATKILSTGAVTSDGVYSSSGADYAEMFEWLDGNPDEEDRVGYFVTLVGDKIRKATSANEYIVGVVSATPSIIGDAGGLRWQSKYVTDDWGRIQYHDVTIPAVYDDNGVEIMEERVERQPVLNPEWDNETPYDAREDRKEWSAVGLMGKLYVRDDGTAETGGFVRPDDEGIATASETGYRVMKRITPNIVQVLVI
ncbi:peptidase G2 autoproteolytic cleavage domain-containing protein [Cohnella faecalis]|uniref:peptidase G2 autoproteolytic cleavage domain-containing protein n=1 Tax=Cohnella faecalis TaxID=2315694 RepID=UPI001F2BF813|nr:peptidase G2 autoproteolytic cleavage domain-containing protein [Cohnella faecalis]